MNTQWASQLNPVLANPLINGHLIIGVNLFSGDNVINHLLSRMMQGWFIADQSSGVTIYRSAPLNGLTLTLNSSGTVIVSLWVF
jgi:hypothetical protein